MDTKDIVIIVESVLLVVLLIVLFAVIVRGGGQVWPFSSKQKEIEESQLSRVLAKSKKVQALNKAEAIANGTQSTRMQRNEIDRGFTRGYRVGRYRYPGGVSDSAYSDW